jgi:hypothetical protein
MNACDTTATRRERCLAVMRGIAIAALVAQLLFAHGCHGDEDHELLVRTIAGTTTSR